MRKSFAPSSQSIRGRTSVKQFQEVSSTCSSIRGKPSNPVRSASSILDLLNGSSCNSESPTFSTCQENSSWECASSPPDLSKSEKRDNSMKMSIKCDEIENFQPTPLSDLNNPAKRKYNVVWGKLSKKKHKKWEGDGVAEIGLNSVVLKDCDGKILGSTRSVKTEQLEEGSRLIVGGKEIELIDLIPFTGNEETVEKNSLPQQSAASPTVSRPVKRPKLMPSRMTKSTPVNSQDAFVMPMPPSEHQWLHNQERLPLTDVVIDPCLSRVLRPHQRLGIQFLYECVCGMRNPLRHQTGLSTLWQGCILADEMGLGKTLQCITLIWTLLRKGPYDNRPIFRYVLIITPSSLAANWLKEFQRWLGREKIKPFIVNQKNRPHEFLNQRSYQVMIISYEMVIRCIEDIKKIPFDVIICDEGHRLKNTIIKTTQALSQLNVKRRIILTGTPIQNDLQEFYSLVDFVNPGILGSSFEFRKHYEGPIVASRQPNCSEEERRLGETRAAELNTRTAWFILRRTQAIINQYLPKKFEFVLFCNPHPLQAKLYRAAIQFWEMQNKRGDESEKGVAHLAILTTMKKICNHPKLLLAYDAEEMALVKLLQNEMEGGDEIFECLSEHSGKLRVVDELLLNFSKAKERVILVSYYTQTLDIFSALCESRNYKYCRLDGSVPTVKRMNIVDSFNSAHQNHFVFLLSARAGGVGLNLTGASRLVLYDSDWNPASDLQAMARIWRDGQLRSVYIYRLLTTGTIEEKIYQRQINKTGLSGAVVDPQNPSGIKLSLEELKDLFTFHENTSCLTHELLGCGCQTIEASTEGDNLPSNDTEVNEIDERDCQLGLEMKTTQGNSLPISQLNNWQHLSPPFEVPLLKEMGLSSSHNVITFIFQSSSE